MKLSDILLEDLVLKEIDMKKSANARSCVDTAQVGIPIKDVTRIPVNCLSVHRQTIFV